jgi:hypothetical protein
MSIGLSSGSCEKRVLSKKQAIEKASTFYKIWFTPGTILEMRGSARWVSRGSIPSNIYIYILYIYIYSMWFKTLDIDARYVHG